jgi:hypothetical protein
MSGRLDEAVIIRTITETLGGVDVQMLDDDAFFFYDPGRGLPVDRRLPFATLVTSDKHDQASDLNRPGVFRLNVGVSAETFRSLFGELPPAKGGPYEPITGYDFTVLDTLLPHPVYGRLHWLCVLSPSPETFARIRGLLAEAHQIAAERYARGRQSGSAQPGQDQAGTAQEDA